MSNVRVISIAGLNKADVLAALYNGASPKQAGFKSYVPQPMTGEEAEGFLPGVGDGNFVEYVNGRPIKVWFHDEDETINAVSYNHDNGDGLAQEIIDGLRTTGQVYNLATQALHIAHTAMRLQEVAGPFDIKAFVDNGMALVPNSTDEKTKPTSSASVIESTQPQQNDITCRDPVMELQLGKVEMEPERTLVGDLILGTMMLPMTITNTVRFIRQIRTIAGGELGQIINEEGLEIDPSRSVSKGGFTLIDQYPTLHCDNVLGRAKNISSRLEQYGFRIQDYGKNRGWASGNPMYGLSASYTVVAA